MPGIAANIHPMPETSESQSGGHHSIPSRGQGGLVSIVAVVLAVVAVALAVWALISSHSANNSKPDYSGAQRSDAKTKICAAADVVRRGVSLNTNLQPPGGPQDVTGTLAVAANARVALYDGGQYLLDRLDPATPSDLADAVTKFANSLMDIGANATSGAQNSQPEQAARLHDADAQNTTIQDLCK
jgi:hypothetical protein